ncbi:helix-turn-helix transcriptional regulator [Candidatus Nomurabacteria bacterium]|nr:helix-turn-helix transcriptional regulator [Candidatus Nomurabacteria bacterium]
MIGKRIQEYRMSLRYKTKEFAQIVGISQGSLSDIENLKTKPSADTLESLVRNTDINPEWLLTGEGSVKRGERVKFSAAGELEGEAVHGKIKINKSILKDARRSMDDFLNKLGGSFTEDQRMDYIADCYDIFSEAKEKEIANKVIEDNEEVSLKSAQT